jgi:hypothetical protein
MRTITSTLGSTTRARSTVHLFRFLRNTEAHRPKQDSGAAAVLEGPGMAGYFVSCFPKLALEVWLALKRAGWSTRTPGLNGYYSSNVPSPYSPSSVPSPTSPAMAAAFAPVPPALPLSLLSAATTEELPLRAWLVPINPALEQYVGALVAYGYEDTTILQEAEAEDLQEAFEECKIKKPHRRLIPNAFEGLKKNSQL